MWVKYHCGMHICTSIRPKDNWNCIYFPTYWIQIIASKNIIVFCDYVMTFWHGYFMVFITRLIIPHLLPPIISWPIIFTVYSLIVAIAIMDIVASITQTITTIEKIRNE